MAIYNTAMRITSLLFVSALSLALPACASTEMRPTDIPAQMTFAQMPPLPLDVQTVTVNSAVPDESGTNPLQHVNIAESFKKYAQQRFVGSGGVGSGTLTITLDETAVSKGMTNTDNKWTSWTHMDKMGDYKSHIKVSLRYDAADGSFKTATLQQERGLQVPQRASLAEREQLEQQMVEKLIYDLDRQIVPALQTRLMILNTSGGML